MTQYRIVEFERMIQFVTSFLIALNIHQDIMRLVNLLNQIGKLTSSPVFKAMNPAVFCGYYVPIPLDHCGHLLALVGVDNENDFVMSHAVSLWVEPPEMRTRWGKVGRSVLY